MTTVILRLAGAECVLRGDAASRLAAALRVTGDLAAGPVREAALTISRRLTDAEAWRGAALELETEPELAALERALAELGRTAPLVGELGVLLQVVRSRR